MNEAAMEGDNEQKVVGFLLKENFKKVKLVEHI